MKQTLLALLGVILVSTPLAIQADQSGDFTYSSNGTNVTITGYTGAGGAVNIPGTIHALPVTSIGQEAFVNCSSLTGVTIPNSITSIGGWAFYGCYNLTRATIPGGIISIERQAFYDCRSLTNVAIPGSVTNIGEWAFANCASLTNITVAGANTHYSSAGGVLFNKTQTTLVQCPGGKTGGFTIPGNVTVIADAAFSGCERLTSVTIPNGITVIGVQTFEDCRSLTNVNIPGSITNIGNWAFQCCYSLPSVTIPASVASIAAGAFSCTGLTNITVAGANAHYSSAGGALFNKTQTTLIQCPGGNRSYTIPGNVSVVAYGAFYGCEFLTNVVIPGSITNIGENAFAYCYRLPSVTIPGSVISIGGGAAFYGCDDLTNITVAAANAHYSSADGVLFNKSQTTLIRCPGGKTDGYAIAGTVTNIGDEAFARCANLTSVTIPGSVTSIGEQAFLYCAGLTGIYAHGNAPSLLGDDVFTGDDKATVYYVSGTAGWGPTFGGRPTAVWNALWSGATDLGNGWKWLSWFGYLNTSADPWVHHNEHGWLYAVGTDTNSICFWDQTMAKWWWTSATDYPYVYRFSDSSWLWYEKGSSNPRLFYNLTTSQWETW